MRLFTISLKSDPEKATIVLAIRDDGALLIANDDHSLRWVSSDECMLGMVYRDPLELAWWNSLSSEDHNHHG